MKPTVEVTSQPIEKGKAPGMQVQLLSESHGRKEYAVIFTKGDEAFSGLNEFGPPGYECDFLYLVCLAALVLGRSGPLAIDGLLRKNKWTLKHKRHHDWSAS